MTPPSVAVALGYAAASVRDSAVVLRGDHDVLPALAM
jgi:hypothetical protein